MKQKYNWKTDNPELLRNLWLLYEELTFPPIPKWFEDLEEIAYTSLSKKRQKNWPIEILTAIPLGKDLEPVYTQFVRFLVIEELELEFYFGHPKYETMKNALLDKIADKFLELIRNLN